MSTNLQVTKKGFYMDRRIAIVGGGISGLLAGYRLQEAGYSSDIFEKSPFPGGRMSSETVDGYTIDKGAYTLPEFYHGLNRLLKELDLSNELIKTPSTSATYLDGKAYDIKVGSPLALLKFKLLSLKSKIDLIKIALYAKSLGRAIDISHPTHKSFALEQETAAEFINRKYGDEILDRIAYPLFSELFLGNPEFNSKLPFLYVLANLTTFKIFTFKSGMGFLSGYLSKQLNLHLETPVHRIRKCSGGAGYEVFAGKSTDSPETYDAIILALPLPAIADVLESVPDSIKAGMKAIEYCPSIVTVWGAEKSEDWPTMINNFSRKETEVIGTVISDNQKMPGRVPQGKQLTTVILNEEASRELLNSSDERIREKTIKEISRFSPSFKRQVGLSRIYRWPYAAMQFPPGALLKRKALREKLEKELGRIYIAGDSLDRTSVEVSLKSGMAAAQRAIEAFS